MDAFWGIVLIGGVVFYFLNKAGNAKVADQQRQARLARQEAEFKASAKKLAQASKKPIAKTSAEKSITKAPVKKAVSKASQSRAPGWKPNYDLAALVKEMVASDVSLFKKELYIKQSGL